MSQSMEMGERRDNQTKTSNPSFKVINRDRVEIDINKDLDQLRRLMMSMNVNNNDRQQLINLFAQMATNKEKMYNETLKMQNGLQRLNNITESLQVNQDMLQGMQDETRMIFRYINDPDGELKEESNLDDKSQVNSPKTLFSMATGFSPKSMYEQNTGSQRNLSANRAKQSTFVTGAVRLPNQNSLERKESFSSKIKEGQNINSINLQKSEKEDLKLMQFLKDWDKEEPQTNYDIDLYANELWMTTKQFEDDLKKHYHVYNLQLEQVTRSHYKREQTMKEKFEFYVDATEKAVNQLKLDIVKMKDQYEMQICDYQSFLYNQHIPFDDINNLVRMDNLQLSSDNQHSTDQYIKSLQKCIRSLKLEVKHLDTQLLYARKDIKSLEDKNSNLKEQLNQSRDYCVQGAAQILKFFNSINLIDEEVGKQPLIVFRDNFAINSQFIDTYDNIMKFSVAKFELVSKHFLQMKKVLTESIKKQNEGVPKKSIAKTTINSPRSGVLIPGFQTQGSIKLNEKSSDGSSQVITNDSQRAIRLIIASYMGIETLDGKPKDLLKIQEGGRRQTIIVPNKQALMRKQTTKNSNSKSKKSKLIFLQFGSLLQIPTNDFDKRESSVDSKASPLHRRNPQSFFTSGSLPGRKSARVSKLKATQDPTEKYKIDFEAYRNEDDRLTFKQGTYLLTYIEEAFNIKLPKEIQIEIVNQISVERLFVKLNQIMLDVLAERKRAENYPYPISDLIEVVKGVENGEFQGFQINHKMARLMFIKSLNDECSLRKEVKVETHLEKEIQTYFPDYFRSKLRELYLGVTYQLPDSIPYKFEKLTDECDNQQDFLKLPIKHIYATNIKDILNEDNVNYEEKKIKLNLELFMDQLSNKLKDIIKTQYDKQFEAHQQLREYENKIENAGEELPKKGEKFKFKINFDELFMDEKTLAEMKKTLARLTQKMSRRKAINQSNDDILNDGQLLDSHDKSKQKNSFSRKESVMQAEKVMAERYQSLMRPLDEVTAAILLEAEKNGIFLENTKIDQLLAAALREDDKTYVIEILTQFLTNLREVVEKHPEYHTVLLVGKNGFDMNQQRVIMSKEEKQNYYRAKIEDLERLIKRQKTQQSGNYNQSLFAQGSNSKISKIGALLGESLKNKIMNSTIVSHESTKVQKESYEKVNSIERKKTNLFLQSRKQANKFMLSPNEHTINSSQEVQKNQNVSIPELKQRGSLGVLGNTNSKPITQQKSRRRSILQTQQNPRNLLSFQNYGALNGSQESTEFQSSVILNSQRSTVRNNNQLNIISSEGENYIYKNFPEYQQSEISAVNKKYIGNLTSISNKPKQAYLEKQFKKEQQQQNLKANLQNSRLKKTQKIAIGALNEENQVKQNIRKSFMIIDEVKDALESSSNQKQWQLTPGQNIEKIDQYQQNLKGSRRSNNMPSSNKIMYNSLPHKREELKRDNIGQQSSTNQLDEYESAIIETSERIESQESFLKESTGRDHEIEQFFSARQNNQQFKETNDKNIRTRILTGRFSD
eukprot:403350485